MLNNAEAARRRLSFGIANCHDDAETARIADTLARASMAPIPARLQRAKARWMKFIDGLTLGEWVRPTPDAPDYVLEGDYHGSPVRIALAPITGNYRVLVAGQVRGCGWIVRRGGDGYPFPPLKHHLEGWERPMGSARRWYFVPASPPDFEVHPDARNWWAWAVEQGRKEGALVRGPRTLACTANISIRRVPGLGLEVSYDQELSPTPAQVARGPIHYGRTAANGDYRRVVAGWLRPV